MLQAEGNFQSAPKWTMAVMNDIKVHLPTETRWAFMVALVMLKPRRLVAKCVTCAMN
jgi:hypothetical protein